ncbi:MAG TPA: HigA family addiction module antitoxin [Kiloniellaceae bacterium]|nr:HigA family addiction module antitoxin [Kiloniellaceae bacterium]
MLRIAVHPGEILKDELDETGVSAAELARQIRVPAGRISQIIAGKRSITGDTALRLGKWFGTGPELWMNLQKNYELRLASEDEHVRAEIQQISSVATVSTPFSADRVGKRY